jgi:hypothetical protein
LSQKEAILEKFQQSDLSDSDLVITQVKDLKVSLVIQVGLLFVCLLWSWDLQLPIQSVPITTVVSSNLDQGKVYNIITSWRSRHHSFKIPEVKTFEFKCYIAGDFINLI